ncbi:unnamed protein product [Calypogeia fissa]
MLSGRQIAAKEGGEGMGFAEEGGVGMGLAKEGGPCKGFPEAERDGEKKEFAEERGQSKGFVEDGGARMGFAREARQSGRSQEEDGEERQCAKVAHASFNSLRTIMISSSWQSKSVVT